MQMTSAENRAGMTGNGRHIAAAGARRLKRGRAASLLAVAAASAISGAFNSTPARGAVYTWDPSANGSGSGGAGTWDTTTSDWFNGADTTWPDTNASITSTAVFGGAGGAVTIQAAGIFANGLTFNTTGYILSGGKLNMGGTTPTITANSSATISSVIAGSGGLVTTGSGTLTLTQSNIYTGGTTISGGTLQLNNASAAQGTITLAGGALNLNFGSNFNWNNAITLTADATIGDGNGQVNQIAAVNGNGHTLNISNANNNLLYFNGTAGSAFGQVNILAGYGAEQLDNGTPLRNAPMNISSGAGFATYSTGTVNNNITLNGGNGAGGNGALYNQGNGTATYSGTIALAAGNSTINATSGNIIFSNSVTGAGSLTLNGGGNTLSLSSTNTYSGTTTINSGTLAITGAGLLSSTGTPGTYAGNISDGGTFIYGSTASDTLSGTINGGGALKLTAAGVLTLPNGAGYTGATTVSAGRLVTQNGLSSTAIAISSGAVLEFNYAASHDGGATVTFTGGGTLRKTGAGILVWGGNAATFNLGAGSLIDVEGGTFTGASNGNEVWTNNLSSLFVASGATFQGVEAAIRLDALNGSGTVTGGYSNQGSVTLGVNNGSGTFSGSLQNSGNAGGVLTLVKAGTGAQVISGLDTYTGATTVSAGALNLQSNSALGTGTGNTTSSVTLVGGAALQLQGGISTTTAVPLTLNGTGVAASPNGALENVSGVNSYSGPITLGSNTTIGSDAGTLKLTNTGTIHGGGFGLALAGSGNGSIASVIDATTSGLTTTGAGTWTLTASNTFTGATTVSAGTLVVDHSGTNTGALANTSGVTISPGATLQVKGSTSVGSTVSSSGTVSLVDNTTTPLNLATIGLAGSSINLELGNSGNAGTADEIIASGAATVSGTNTINLYLAAGQSVVAGSTVTLLSATSGLTGTFTVGARPAGFYTFNLSNSDTAETLNITGNPTPGTAYWTGAASVTGSDAANLWGFGSALATAQSNWSSNRQGTSDTLQVPGASTNVIFTAANATGNGGTLNTQLDANYSIQSLTIAVPSATNITATTVNTNGNVLSIGTGGLTVASAIDPTNPNASSLTINGTGSIALAGSEAWANNHATVGLSVTTPITGVTGATILTLNGTGAGGVNLSGPISNGTATSVGLAISQAGVTTLTGVNTYTGGTTISSGTLAGTTASLQGNITNNGALVFDQTLPASPIASGTYAGVISGSGSVTKNGAGAVIFTANNSYAGPTTISGGTLQLGDGTSGNGNVGAGVTLAGGALTLSYNGFTRFNNNITLTADSTFGNRGPQVNLGGTLTGGNHTLTVDNATDTNNLYFNGAPGATSLAQVNVVNGIVAEDGPGDGGGVPLRNAVIVVSNGAAFGTYTNPTINNNITLNGGDGPNHAGVLQNQGNGVPTYTGSITLNAGNSSIGTGGGNIKVTGGIGGGGSLTKIAANTLILGNASTYSGGTTINAGLLQTTGAGLGTGPVTLSGGSIAVNDGTTTTAQTLTTASHTWKGSSGYTARVFNDGTSDQLSITAGTSTLTIDPTVATASPFTVTASATTGSLDPTVSRDWVIAGGITNLSGVLVPTAGNPTVLATAGAGASTSGFVLSLPTSLFSGTEASAPVLELESVGGGSSFSLDVVYNAAPEPGSALMVLAGALPILAGRRRKLVKG